MEDDLRVRIELDDIARLLASVDVEHREALTEEARRGLARGMQIIERDVIANRLSGQYLNVRTGTLRKSISSRAVSMRDRLLGEVGTSLVYGRAHELGFAGEVTRRAHSVRAHTRRMRGRSVSVRAHERRQHTANLKIRPRRFLRHSVRDNLDTVKASVALKVVNFFRSSGT